MASCEMEYSIPRLNVSVPSAIVKGLLLGALVQLGYKSPTEDEEKAILDFIKGCNIFVSLSTGEGKSLCLRQSSVHF